MSARSASRTSDKLPELLLDTSVAVPLLLGDHPHHRSTIEAVAGRVTGLAGHALFETFSVLTRLPTPARRPPDVVAHMLATNFPVNLFLSPQSAADLPRRLAQARIAGGSVYDALVAAAALEHGVLLATRDRRAILTYHALQVPIEVMA